MNDDYSFIDDSRKRLQDSREPRENSRRGFIKGTGSLVALGSLPGYLSANMSAVQDSISGLQQLNGLVLYRENDQHSRAFADIMTQAGLTSCALTDDLVRQWRDGLMTQMSGVPVLGLTNWADYLVINGLAAEQRKHVVLELQHAVAQSDKKNWSANLAINYLQLPIKTDARAMQEHFRDTVAGQSVAPGQRSLFSWLIS